MKLLLLLLLVVICAAEEHQATPCLADNDVYGAFHLAFDEFVVIYIKAVAAQANTSFASSVPSVWITLAAIAEGADPATQKEIFTLLNLPKDLCSRQKIYNMASTRTSSSKYFTGVRALVIDDGAQVNPQWHDLIASNSLLDIISVPMRNDVATTTASINKIAALKTENINLNSTSILLNTLNYNGLWNTAFPDAVLERTPFYNHAGEEIGKVDMMRVVRKARMVFIESVQTNVLELDIGENNDYIFWISVPESPSAVLKSFTKDGVLEVKESFKGVTMLPIDIAIPRFHIDTELDIKKILTSIGILSNLWTSEEATRLISTPPATPSAYFEHTRITIANKGVFEPTLEDTVPQANKDQILTKFIANKAFLFDILDKETYTSILCGFYAHPPLN